MSEDITSKAAADKAMKNRCDRCKQMEEFLADSVYFNDGDSTVENLLAFRKSGFMGQEGKECACYTMRNKRKRSTSNE